MALSTFLKAATFLWCFLPAMTGICPVIAPGRGAGRRWRHLEKGRAPSRWRSEWMTGRYRAAGAASTAAAEG